MENEDNTYPRKIGLAYSNDGFSFTKNPSNPVLEGTPSEWDAAHVSLPVILYHSGIYYMYYGGVDGASDYDWQVGVATSTNGISFTKNLSNPILSPTGSGWESKYVHATEVIFREDDNRFWMYYRGSDGTGTINDIMKIGLAYSDDGINWIRDDVNNPIMKATEPWEGNRITTFSIFYYAGKWRCFYGAHIGVGSRIGYAESDDGIQWIKFEYNPVLSPLGNGWEEKYVLIPRFVFRGGNFDNLGLVYYVGNDANGKNRIGVIEQLEYGNFISLNSG